MMRSIVRGSFAGRAGASFGNGDQVVGDQVEHEIGCNAADDAMFCFAHCAMLLAPTEDAFDHRPARLRHA